MLIRLFGDCCGEVLWWTRRQYRGSDVVRDTTRCGEVFLSDVCRGVIQGYSFVVSCGDVNWLSDGGVNLLVLRGGDVVWCHHSLCLVHSMHSSASDVNWFVVGCGVVVIPGTCGSEVDTMVVSGSKVDRFVDGGVT